MTITNADILNEISKLRNDFIDKIKETENNLILRLTNLHQENLSLKRRIKYLEKEKRRNNVVIFGLDIANVEAGIFNLGKFVCKKLQELLHIELQLADINNVFVVGKNGSKRPIVLQLVSFLKKVEILNNRAALKGQNIFINNDLPPEEAQEQKILRQNLKLARNKGLRAFIKANRLHVGEETFTAKELEEAEDTDLETIKPPESGTVAEVEKSEEMVSVDVVNSKANSAPSTPSLDIEKTLEEEVFTDLLSETTINEKPVPGMFLRSNSNRSIRSDSSRKPSTPNTSKPKRK